MGPPLARVIGNTSGSVARRVGVTNHAFVRDYVPLLQGGSLSGVLASSLAFASLRPTSLLGLASSSNVSPRVADPPHRRPGPCFRLTIHRIFAVLWEP